jgi:signal peptidase II
MVKRVILVFGIIAVVIGIDQWSKVWAVNTLMGEPSTSYLGDFFRLTFARNTGAFLSLGSGLSDNWRYWALTILPVLVLLFLLYQTLFSKTMSRWQIIAFSSILGGGLSNIYDRIMYGSVVDFLNMGIGNFRTGIFNVADMGIMAGLFMMLPLMFQRPPKKETPPTESTEPTEPS